MGLKLKCGTKGSAGDRGTKPVTVPSRGGSSSSDSRRQTDQGARRAMSPEYGDEPGPLGETRTPDCVQPCWGCSSELRPCRSSRIRGVHSATSCRAFQIKALLFLRVLFFIFFFFSLSHLNWINYLNACFVFFCFHRFNNKKQYFKINVLLS